MKRWMWVASALAALLAACSGSVGSVPPASGTLPTAAPQGNGHVTFVVVVPAGTQPSLRHAVRRPNYISPSTQSVTIALGGSKLLAMDVSATSKACSTAKSGARSCTAKSTVATGSQTFAIEAFDGPNGTGNVLASGNVTKTIAANSPQTVAVSLTGTPASIALSFANPYPPAGTAASIGVTLAVLDADGNTILGAYGKAIKLSNSDTSGITKLSATSLSKSSNALTLAYTGAALSQAVITASAPGLPRTTAVFAPSPTVVKQWPVPNIGPTIKDRPAGLSDLAYGPDGNVWGTDASSGGIQKISPEGKFTTYPVFGTFPVGISVGADKNLWFCEQLAGAIAKITTAGKITAYTIPVPPGTFSQPNWTTLGSDGRTWFVDQGTATALGAIDTATGKMTLYPLASNIFPVEIVTGPDKNIWMTDDGRNSIDVFSTSGKLLAQRPIPTASASPWGIAVGPDKNIWFAEYQGNKIGRMTPSGSVKEFAVPTSVAGPLNVAAGPDGKIWFTESGGSFAIAGKVGYITTNGSSIRDFPIPNADMHVHDLTFDAAGNLWFSMFSGPISRLGKLVY